MTHTELYINKLAANFQKTCLEKGQPELGLHHSLLERQLTYENFVEWTKYDELKMQQVEVGLPKFKLEENMELGETLVSMGMIDAFDHSKSDFSGMSSNNDLVLSKVVHKAFVEVNEEGTEAAASTRPIMMMRCALKMATFFANNPSLFFVRHNPTQSILFLASTEREEMVLK